MLDTLLHFLMTIYIVIYTVFAKKNRELLIWGTTPLISNKYWSKAVNGLNIGKSVTLMGSYYRINNKKDYDLYYDDVIPKSVSSGTLLNTVFPEITNYFVFMYIIKNAKVIHISFHGGPLGALKCWRIEGLLYKYAGIKVVAIPYGADAYAYSRIRNMAWANGLMTFYPNAALQDSQIQEKVRYWSKYADCVIPCLMSQDGFSRWDMLPYSVITIDTGQWLPVPNYSKNDGENGSVTIIHTPNHRIIKGTEYLIEAVRALKEEGLNINLVLLEGKSNEEVRKQMQNADILVEQLLVGYALSAIEGMASGLPVISNLEYGEYINVFRIHSYLNECPIVSGSPENIADRLRVLVKNPGLREALGRAGRKYVEKYHSERTARYMFGAVYDKILFGKKRELASMFHPLLSEYNRTDRIEHPLTANKIPAEFYN